MPRLLVAGAPPMHPLPSFRSQALASLLVLALSACGGSSSSSSISPAEVGVLQENPASGGLFFVDAHQRGQARDLHLADTYWARLVDVHDVDAGGAPSAQPLLSDVPVRPDVESDGADFAL